MKRLLLLIFLASCASSNGVGVNSVDDIEPITKTESQRLSALFIGMNREDFTAIFPDAYIVGQNENTTAFEITKTTNYYIKTQLIDDIKVYKDILWFYFYNDRLIKWGRPDDWPQNPDLIIETR